MRLIPIAAGVVLSCLFVCGAQVSLAQDVFYFHDSGANSVWDSEWAAGIESMCPPELGIGEYMDCTEPLLPTCSEDRVGDGLLCHLHLPGCTSFSYPAGTWTATLYVKGDSLDIQVNLLLEAAEPLCSDVIPLASDIKTFAGSDVCVPLEFYLEAFPITAEDGRLFLQIAEFSPTRGDIYVCWDSPGCPSSLTATGDVLCGPSATKREAWGAIKALYR